MDIASRRAIAILIPMRNDWDSLRILLEKIDTVLQDLPDTFDIHVVDDYSLPPIQFEHALKSVRTVKHHNLTCNLGHQRAIAIGLVLLVKRYHYDGVIIMDADGEDCPQNIPQLLDASQDNDSIVVAKRDGRSETAIFKLFYKIYKMLFVTLTGHRIDFGNYCFIPKQFLYPLVHYSGLWNHLAATIVASRLPIIKIGTNRCQRYAGESKMNFARLIIHGLSAISLFIEIVLVRLLFLAISVCLLSVIGIFIVIFLRVFTDLAIPGWATTSGGIFLILAMQSLIVIVGILLFLLQNRDALRTIPIQDSLVYLDDRQITDE